jgi:hypothetical protein
MADVNYRVLERGAHLEHYFDSRKEDSLCPCDFQTPLQGQGDYFTTCFGVTAGSDHLFFGKGLVGLIGLLDPNLHRVLGLKIITNSPATEQQKLAVQELITQLPIFKESTYAFKPKI